jgi:GTP-binding protein Era
MKMETSNEFRSGFVTIVGRPNVGKSTLLNNILKQKIASISPRPQTTRRKQLGIFTDEKVQIVFVDTPGIHTPVHKLGEYMNQVAEDTLRDADLILWLVDATVPPQEEDSLVAQFALRVETMEKVILVLNKTDLVDPATVQKRKLEYETLMDCTSIHMISALSGKGVKDLIAELTNRLPVGFPFYDPEQVTDLYEKEIAADFIREAAMIQLKDELPHAVAVRVDEYHDIGETNAEIFATIFVERESQKPIVIGKGGAMIKVIGETSRKEIEKLIERKVFLELRVKVLKNWRNDPSALRQFGYQHQDDK